jgi:hypothetical protein
MFIFAIEQDIWGMWSNGFLKSYTITWGYQLVQLPIISYTWPTGLPDHYHALVYFSRHGSWGQAADPSRCWKCCKMISKMWLWKMYILQLVMLSHEVSTRLCPYNMKLKWQIARATSTTLPKHGVSDTTWRWGAMNARGGAGPIEVIRVLSYQSVLCSVCIEGVQRTTVITCQWVTVL